MSNAVERQKRKPIDLVVFFKPLYYLLLTFEQFLYSNGDNRLQELKIEQTFMVFGPTCIDHESHQSYPHKKKSVQT